MSPKERQHVVAKVECTVIDISCRNAHTFKGNWKEYIVSLDRWLGYYFDKHSQEMPRMPSFQLPKINTPIQFFP